MIHKGHTVKSKVGPLATLKFFSFLLLQAGAAVWPVSRTAGISMTEAARKD